MLWYKSSHKMKIYDFHSAKVYFIRAKLVTFKNLSV